MGLGARGVWIFRVALCARVCVLSWLRGSRHGTCRAFAVVISQLDSLLSYVLGLCCEVDIPKSMYPVASLMARTPAMTKDPTDYSWTCHNCAAVASE